MNVVIPMAGLGSRLPPEIYGTIKPLIPINGVPMITHTINSLGLDGHLIFVCLDNQYSNSLEKLLREIGKKTTLIRLKNLTRGPAETCLAAKEIIDNDTELIIANSDQITWWNSQQFINSARTKGIDGVVVTYSSTSDRNSYARINKDGQVIEIREKKVISSIALSGIHYWRLGRDFVSSAEAVIRQSKFENGEFYVGPTYNVLIESGKKIGIHQIAEFQHNPVGTPDDLQKYKEKLCTHFI